MISATYLYNVVTDGEQANTWKRHDTPNNSSSPALRLLVPRLLVTYGVKVMHESDFPFLKKNCTVLTLCGLLMTPVLNPNCNDPITADIVQNTNVVVMEP